MVKVRKYRVFARHGHKNIVNTMISATRGKKHRTYRGVGLPRRKKKSIFTVFFSSGSVKKMRKHNLCDDFQGR